MNKKIIPFKDQDYLLLKKKHNQKNLFIDPYFPATMKSIYHNTQTEYTNNHYKIEWKRPNVLYNL